jgi:toxin ParE1/3/4
VGNFYLNDDSLSDLENIWTFIALDNPDAADRVIEAVYDTCRLLAENPEIGRIRKLSSSPKEIRSFLVTEFSNYIVYYRPVSDGVQVLRVLHGSRDHGRMFGDPDQG